MSLLSFPLATLLASRLFLSLPHSISLSLPVPPTIRATQSFKQISLDGTKPCSKNGSSTLAWWCGIPGPSSGRPQQLH